MIGSSGTGKSNAIINFIEKSSGEFHKIIICSFSTTDEPLYNYLQQKIPFSRPGGTAGWLLNFRPGSVARHYAPPGLRAIPTHDSDLARRPPATTPPPANPRNAKSSARY